MLKKYNAVLSTFYIKAILIQISEIENGYTKKIVVLNLKTESHNAQDMMVYDSCWKIDLEK